MRLLRFARNDTLKLCDNSQADGGAIMAASF